MNLPLILIVLIGSFFRLVGLSHLPISLFGDEVDVGYHAWSLITTGRDYMGHLLPTYIQSLAEWRAPLLMYVVAPFEGILGPTTSSVRLPIALLGILGIYLIYLLTKALYKSNKLALLAAFILAITPWHIHYSRAAFESTLLLDLVLLGTYLFIREKFTLSLIFFALTFYTYSTANVFVPLLLIGLYIIYRPHLQLKRDWLKILPAFILILPIAFQVLFGHAAGRFEGIGIFSDQHVIDNVIIQRTEPWVSQNNPLDRLFTNKYEAIFHEFLTNYSGSFNKDFLFLNGDPYFRQSVGQVGEFLWPFAAFFLVGLVVLVRRPDKPDLLTIYWLLIAPIPSALTQGGENHATRLFVMIPPIVFFIALGIVESYKFLSKWPNIRKLAILLTAAALIYSFGHYWVRYSVHYKYESAKFWSNGYEDIFTKLAKLMPIKGDLYINNTYEPSLIRFAFFTKLPPMQFQEQFTTDNPTSYKSALFTGFKFGSHIYFGQVNNGITLNQLLKPGDIYLAVQGKEVPGDWDWSVNPPSGLKVIAVTRDVSGKSLFYLVTKQ